MIIKHKPNVHHSKHNDDTIKIHPINKTESKKTDKKDTKKETKVEKAKDNYANAVNTSKPGDGKRFAALSESLVAQGKSPKDAAAIAASAGMKKYGKAKMGKMAAKGMKKK